MIDTEYKVRRYITEFSKKTEELLAEYDLSDFVLNKFKIEFCQPEAGDPMFDCYPIKERNVEFINIYLEKEPEWDFINKAYYVETHGI